MFLLDTNVLSELRPCARRNVAVAAWVGGVPSTDLFLSAISVFELEMGALLMERRDPAQGRVLRGWIEERVLPAFTGRTLPVDIAVARCCAALHVPDPRPERDALIAATALVHQLTVVTRNTVDFRPMGVDLLNPFK